MTRLRRAAAAALAAAALGAAPEAAPAGDLIEIKALPFTVLSDPALRRHAERIAAEAPALAASLAAELRVPPLPQATIAVLGPPREGASLRSLAPAMPPWAAGVALPSSSTILLRLDRIGGYGQREIGSVLAHEITHLLVAAALPHEGRDLPAWLREGIASSSAREGEWRDLWIVWTSSLGSSDHPFADLDASFDASEPSRRLAYAGSLAAVGFLRRSLGPDLPARLLAEMRRPLPFHGAFLAASGVSVAEAEAAWRADLRRPQVWLIRISSSYTLWAALTLMALLAYALKRRRSRRLLEAWRAQEGPDLLEEREAPEPDEEERPPRRPGGRDPGSGGEWVN